MCVGEMLNILSGELCLTFMKAWLTKRQQVVEVHEDGYKNLIEEGGTYRASGVLFDGGKWNLRCVRSFVGSFFGGFLFVEVL